MILGYDKGTEKGVILGKMLIFVAKWTIWKQRNKIKYQNFVCKPATLIIMFKAELKENLKNPIIILHLIVIMKYIYYSKIELNNLLITLELILSIFWNTYITFIVEGKITFRGRSISFFYVT